MRYIANDRGYLQEVSFGAMIYCNDRGCTEYTGGVPEGYDSLADWFVQECDKLHRWHIVEGELTLDENAPEPEAEPERETVLVPITAMSKLWENDSPTSGFSAQTVTLDLSGYDGVSVLYKNENGGNAFLNTGYVPKGRRGRMTFLYQSSGNRSERYFTANDSGIEIEAGAYSGGSTTSIHCVPIEIYGWTTKMFKAYTNKGDTTDGAICGTFLCGELVCG